MTDAAEPPRLDDAELIERLREVLELWPLYRTFRYSGRVPHPFAFFAKEWDAVHSLPRRTKAPEIIRGLMLYWPLPAKHL
jgi:hypothetical protein